MRRLLGHEGHPLEGVKMAGEFVAMSSQELEPLMGLGTYSRT